MKPKKVRVIFLAIFLLGLVVGVIGFLLDNISVVVGGVILLICDYVFLLIFHRCPHCGRHIDKLIGDYCRFCGKSFGE